MRRPFGKLMEMVAQIPEDNGVSLGDLSLVWDEPVERIMDAIDAVRICDGGVPYI